MITERAFDICQAYYQIEVDYNCGGWLQERPSNVRRREATHVQLHRMRFSVGAGWRGYESLSDEGKEIYHDLERRYGFTVENGFDPMHAQAEGGDDVGN